MARIAGIDLPRNKRGVIGLTYIYGIGPSTAKKLLMMLESITIQKWANGQMIKYSLLRLKFKMM